MLYNSIVISERKNGGQVIDNGFCWHTFPKLLRAVSLSKCFNVRAEVKWAVPSENLFRQWRAWSDCADAQSDQGIRCPQTELLDIIRAFPVDNRNH